MKKVGHGSLRVTLIFFAGISSCAFGGGGDLRGSVSALPEITQAEKAKKGVLEVALERAESSLKVGETASAAALQADITAALAADPEAMDRPDPAVKNISALFPVITAERNPYIDRLASAGRQFADGPDVEWPKFTTDGAAVFIGPSSGEYDCRGTAARLDALLWLYANPASPLRGDPAVLKKYLRRAHAYADALDVQSAIRPGQLGKNILDDFAIAPASCALREFARLYPGLLLPSQRAQWDRAMRATGDKILAHSDDQLAKHASGYPNIDLAIAYQLLNFGLYLNDEKMLARSREMIARFARQILPDGGTNYIWSQNESAGYHDVIAMFLARTHEITGDPMPVELLKRLEWYGPVSVGRIGEYWTAPAWKHTWNSGLHGIVGGEYVAGVTGNPYVRGMIGKPAFDQGAKGWESARSPVAWYRNDVAPEPLPNNVTYPDRNIAGPRAWYGRFTYAATLRAIPEEEPGHTTLIGAQVTTPGFDLDALLMGVFPRVQTGSDAANPRSQASLTSGMTSAVTVGRTFSAFSASYDLSSFSGSQKGEIAPWRGRQIWLGLPDRIIGLLQVEPKAGASAFGVAGIIRLGTGGTVNGSPKTIQSLTGNKFQYGDIVVIVHQTNFPQLSPRIVPFRLPQFPVTEITLSDCSLDAPADKQSYEKGFFFVVEIRPSWTTTDAQIAASREPPAGMEVTIGPKHFLIQANFSECAMPLIAGPADRIYRTDGATDAANLLPPMAQAVFVTSPEEADRADGWKSFQEMVGASGD